MFLKKTRHQIVLAVVIIILITSPFVYKAIAATGLSVGSSTLSGTDDIIYGHGGSSTGNLLNLINNSGASFVVDNNGNLDLSGTVSGAFVGTLNAGNVSSGEFGSNTGGGNYSFPGNVTIADGSYINGADDDVRFHGGRADDGNFEWVGWYSGSANRAGIFLWDGAWNGCDTGKFCIFGDTHQLMLKSNTGNILLDDNVDIVGDVGIGTTSPGAKLGVMGNIDVNGNILKGVTDVKGDRIIGFFTHVNTIEIIYSSSGTGSYPVKIASTNRDFCDGGEYLGRIEADGTMAYSTTPFGGDCTIVELESNDTDPSKFLVWDHSEDRFYWENSTPSQDDRQIVGKYYYTGNGRFTWLVDVDRTSFFVEDNWNFGGNRITNLGTPVTGSDAATRSYVDSAAGGGFTGGGTTNYIPKWTDVDSLGNSLLHQDTDTIFSSGNVVIDPSPLTGYQEGLRIKESSNGYTTIALGGTADSGTGVGVWSLHSDPSGNFQIRENGGQLVNILGNGNVGIGITAPSAGLHVANSANDNTPNVAGVQISGGGYAKIELTGSSGSYIDFQNDTTGTDYDARLRLHGDNDFRIDGSSFFVPNGSVGVGIASAAAKLDVAGQIKVGSYGADTNAVPKSYVDGLASKWTLLNNNIYNNNSGNVGIGSSIPVSKLDVDGIVTASGFSGPLSGTISAGNVSSGEFASNTGGGNFSFPGNITTEGYVIHTNKGDNLLLDSDFSDMSAWGGENSYVIQTDTLPNGQVVNVMKMTTTSSHMPRSVKVPYDNTKMYRFSVWLKTDTGGAGTKYFGTDAYNAAGSEVGVYNSGSTSANTNPYFWAGDLPDSGNWHYISGYIMPTNHSTSFSCPPDSYGTCFRSHPDAEDIILRFGNYSYSSGEVNLYVALPTIEEVDAEDATSPRFRGTELLINPGGGNVGIGTNNPGYKLDVNSGNDPIRLGPNSSYGRSLLLGGWGTGTSEAWVRTSGGNLHIDSKASNHIYLNHYHSGNVYIASGGGNVGIGTTNPGERLSVSPVNSKSIDAMTGRIENLGSPINPMDAATRNYVDSILNAYDDPTTGEGYEISGDLNMGGDDILGVNKLTVNTIDPLYEIGDVLYSSYAASVVGGVKEEYIGKTNINSYNTSIGEYEKVIDFGDEREGSELWLWHKTVDFNKDNVDVFVTPVGAMANVYYQIIDDSIILRSNRSVAVSYRLIGKRFDWKSWPTRAKDQSQSAGLKIE